MIALGIDPSVAKPIPVVALSTTGTVQTRTIPVPRSIFGARRLLAIRASALAVLSSFDGGNGVCAIAVETPWSNPKNPSGNSSGIQCQGVLLEAAQTAHPGAVVFEMPSQTWKKESVGNGRASKEEYIAHAAGLGLDDPSEDEAASACLAQAALERWLSETRRAA